MSSEEIIRAWKNDDEDPKQEPSQPPASPAGEQGLSDEELEAVEGGMLGSNHAICTCDTYSCDG